MIEAITSSLGAVSLAGFGALLIGVVVGVIVGALPGMGPFLGVTLAIPFTYSMDAVTSMALLLGIYQGGSYGGAISATLLGIPGTPMAAATLLDAYPMAKAGRASEAISLATISSTAGGVIGGLTLIFGAPYLATIALKFGPAEIFALALLGLTAIASLSQSGSVAKGLAAGVFGLLIASVGNDPITGVRRFTFNSTDLDGGVTLVALLIGVFAISEVAIQIEQSAMPRRAAQKVVPVLSTLSTLVTRPFAYLRASVVGVLVGVIPGIGGITSAFFAYKLARDASGQPETFGKGREEGVIASEAANSATTGGAMIPMLAVGIPGDPVVAVLMGGLMIQGLTPGPMLFLMEPQVVSGIFAVFIIGAILILPVGFLLLPFFVRLLRIPQSILMGGVTLIAILGVYAVQRQIFDLWMMMGFGLVGYAMRKMGFPLAPLVIGFILGPIFEANFRRTMIMGEGDFFGTMAERPIAATIMALSVAILAVQSVNQVRGAMRGRGRAR